MTCSEGHRELSATPCLSVILYGVTAGVLMHLLAVCVNHVLWEECGAFPVLSVTSGAYAFLCSGIAGSCLVSPHVELRRQTPCCRIVIDRGVHQTCHRGPAHSLPMAAKEACPTIPINRRPRALLDAVVRSLTAAAR